MLFSRSCLHCKRPINPPPIQGRTLTGFSSMDLVNLFLGQSGKFLRLTHMFTEGPTRKQAPPFRQGRVEMNGVP